MTKFNYTLDMAPDTVRYRVADATQAARLEALGIGVEFDALSIGSPNGSAAIIPLDESSREIGQRLLQCWNAMLLVDHPDVMVPGGVHIHLALFQQYHKLLHDLKPAIRSLVALMDAIPDSAWPADVDRQELGADMGDCLTLLDAILRPGVPEVVPATKDQQQAEQVPKAWMHEEDPCRVISDVQKQQAIRDGGASASSVRPYSIALVAPEAPAQADRQHAPQNHEEWLAVREGHFNTAADTYFEARPTLDTPENRRIFYAGHCMGYDVAPEAKQP